MPSTQIWMLGLVSALMRSTLTCAAGLKGRPLRPFQALLIISSSIAQRRQPGGGIKADIPGAPEGDEDQHRQRPQQEAMLHLKLTVSRNHLWCPAKGELLGARASWR